MGSIAIIGGGLAGCECALTLADAGIPVLLFEQKPGCHSEAHRSPNLAELVCSNSLRSAQLTNGVGLLKQEMRELGSHFMAAADATQVPADKALAVDREAFSRMLTDQVASSSSITLVERCIRSLDDPALSDPSIDCLVVAAGPLAQEDLSHSLAACIGQDSCYFYDAIAPIVWTHSLDRSIVFRASRYECDTEGFDPANASGDYLNCPMTKEEYFRFHAALTAAETVAGRDFEKLKHFEGCMPIEALAARGDRTLAFGPMKPVGFIDPRTGRRPYAVLQLRAETRSWDTVNLVGCQTRMRHADQERVFRLVPGLEKAEFVRLGSMHRNTFVNAPQVLSPDLSLKARPNVYLAGQITGVEGYVESAASGLWLGHALRLKREGRVLTKPPAETALGGLLKYLETPSSHFQPSNAHFGLLPDIGQKMRKTDRKQAYLTRARAAFASWLGEFFGS